MPFIQAISLPCKIGDELSFYFVASLSCKTFVYAVYLCNLVISRDYSSCNVVYAIALSFKTFDYALSRDVCNLDLPQGLRYFSNSRRVMHFCYPLRFSLFVILETSYAFSLSLEIFVICHTRDELCIFVISQDFCYFSYSRRVMHFCYPLRFLVIFFSSFIITEGHRALHNGTHCLQAFVHSPTINQIMRNETQ